MGDHEHFRSRAIQSHFSQFGQSGSQVSLENRAGEFVIKKTASPGGESRLLAQYEKQMGFQTYSDLGIPKIIDRWNNNSFSMEYVSSVTLGTFSQSASHLDWKKAADTIVNFLRQNINDSSSSGETIAEQEGFRLKATNLKNQLNLPQDLAQAHCLKEITSLARNLPFRLGANHGDLSFENILISTRDQSVWLVDFLDSPMQTPLIDAGRLLIDCEHGWWFSGAKHSVMEAIASQYLSSEIRKLFQTFGVSDAELDFYKLFAAIRILPYTSAPVRRAKLLAIINRTTD